MAEPQPRPCPPVTMFVRGGAVEGYISKEYCKLVNTHVLAGGNLEI